MKGGSRKCKVYYIYDSFNQNNNTIRFKSNKGPRIHALKTDELNEFKESNETSLHINRWLKGSRKFIKKYSKKCGQHIYKYKTHVDGKMKCFYINSCDRERLFEQINQAPGIHTSRIYRSKQTTKKSTRRIPTFIPKSNNRSRRSRERLKRQGISTNVGIPTTTVKKKKKISYGVDFLNQSHNNNLFNNLLRETRQKKIIKSRKIPSPNTIEKQHQQILRNMKKKTNKSSSYKSGTPTDPKMLHQGYI